MNTRDIQRSLIEYEEQRNLMGYDNFTADVKYIRVSNSSVFGNIEYRDKYGRLLYTFFNIRYPIDLVKSIMGVDRIVGHSRQTM